MSQSFDALEYARKLEEAGFTRKQAEIQAEALRIQNDAQMAALKNFAQEQDEKNRQLLATKGDIQDVRLEIERVRAEIQHTKYDLLKWQIGGWIALAAIMAKGFHWLAFNAEYM